MESENNIFVNFFLSTLENVFSLLANGETDLFIRAIVFVLVLLWIYAGIHLYNDAIRRYNTNWFTKVIIFVLGVVTGPVGLFFYVLTRPKFTTDEIDFLKIEHKFYYQQSSKVVECAHCGNYVLDNQEYCTNCGEQNRLRCHNCNTLTNLDDKFCYFCGYKFEVKERQTLLANRIRSGEPLLNLQEPDVDVDEDKSGLPGFFSKVGGSVNAFVTDSAQSLNDALTNTRNLLFSRSSVAGAEEDEPITNEVEDVPTIKPTVVASVEDVEESHEHSKKKHHSKKKGKKKKLR